MDLGGIELQSPLVLAPIAGFTDSPFRRIALSHGAGLVMTELVSAEGLVRNNTKTVELLAFEECERPLGIQIFGNDPAAMAEAARVAESRGPDFIDINLGCPARKVCSGGSGAALLRDPAKVYGIVSAVTARVKLPVTGKIRLGWDSASKNYVENLRALEDAGAAAVIVHGRTREQKYGGRADWDAIAEISSLARIPVVGNGDIMSHDDALSKLARTGCRAVMIGRGALGNPWIFSGRRPSAAEIADQIALHCDLMIDWYGEHGIILLRKHLVHYIHGMKNASRIRSLLVRARDRGEIMEIVRENLGH
jgi:tRNA-dihydrouridine synthase B